MSTSSSDVSGDAHRVDVTIMCPVGLEDGNHKLTLRLDPRSTTVRELKEQIIAAGRVKTTTTTTGIVLRTAGARELSDETDTLRECGFPRSGSPFAVPHLNLDAMLFVGYSASASASGAGDFVLYGMRLPHDLDPQHGKGITTILSNQDDHPLFSKDSPLSVVALRCGVDARECREGGMWYSHHPRNGGRVFLDQKIGEAGFENGMFVRIIRHIRDG